MALTTKYKLAEQSQRIILGGSPTVDSEVAIQELILKVNQAFASIIRRIYFEGRNEGEQWINGNFIYDFDDVEVKKDTKKNQLYSELPSPTVTLPYDMGVYQISFHQDQDNAFVPVPNGYLPLYRGLESGQLEGRIGYYVEKERVYYVNLDENDCPETLLMKLVAPIGSVGDEDKIGIPEDIQEEIVNMTVQLYMTQQQAPHDEVNDNIK